MKVGVSTEYHWNCPRCGEERFVSWMPQIDKKLPKCDCGERSTCDGITEDVRPEK
jgi:hypothetical protein